MNIAIVLGLALIALTIWDLLKEETDTILVLDWWGWFDVSKASHPIAYWLIIAFQFGLGVYFLYQGFSA